MIELQEEDHCGKNVCILQYINLSKTQHSEPVFASVKDNFSFFISSEIIHSITIEQTKLKLLITSLTQHEMLTRIHS